MAAISRRASPSASNAPASKARESRLALETGEREEALDSVLDGLAADGRSFDSKADSASGMQPPND